MTVGPVVGIFCEGNRKIGYGHIRRSLALVEQLKKIGVSAHLIGLSSETKKHIPKTQKSSYLFDVFVFDGMRGVSEKILDAQSQGKITIALDWFGEAVPDVNICLFEHQKVTALHQTFVGFEYAMIRNEVNKAKEIFSSNVTDGVLVCIGGADVHNEGPKAAELLSKEGLQVTLVQGPLAQHYPASGQYRIIRDPSNLSELMLSSKWLVTNGGGCMLEAMCLGKPTIVLPQSPYELNISKFSLGVGALLGIGLETVKPITEARLSAVSQAAANLVDGHGLMRICQIIKKLSNI